MFNLFKKNKHQIIKVEIDYDKLAKTVLNNQQKVEIDYEQLVKTIVKSQEIIEEKKQKKIQHDNEQNNIKWREKFGIKEYSENENFIKKIFHNICSVIKIYWKLLTFKEKDIIDDHVTFNLMKLSLTSIFAIFQYVLYLFYIVLIIAAITSETVNGNYICIAIISFVFAQIFRLSKLEIEKIKDKNYLISILSAVTCFIAMIVAIVALFKG